MPQAAIMPIMLGVSIAATAAGTIMQMNATKDMKGAQQQEIQAQQNIEAERKKQMELEARRKQLEIIRQQQRARSLALSTATAQGAQFGSGIMGGFGQISGASNVNALGVQQNLEIGRSIFGFNQDISSARMSYAGAQSDYATGQGISSLGGMMMRNVGTMNSIFGGGSGFDNNSSTSYPTYGGFLSGIGSRGIY